MDIQDEPLAARIRAGDMEALDILVRTYYTGMVRFAYSLLRSMDAAEDVVQSVICNVCENHADWYPRNIKAYLLTAVRSRAINEIKHESVRARHEDMVHEESQTVVSIFEDMPQDIENFLQQLPENQQTAVRLRYQHDMSFKDIAAILGISPGAAERMIQRAVAGLRAKYRP